MAPFIYSLSVVVKGLANVAVTAALGNALVQFSPQASFRSIGMVAVANALGLNVINNWSKMMVLVSSLSVASSPPAPSLIYATIVGADLGPNPTIVGSLSSML